MSKYLSAQFWSSLAEQTSPMSRHSIALARACYRSPLPARQVLVDEARRHQNAVAAKLLSMDKEWSHLRYYGVAAYLRERQLLPRWAQSTSSTRQSSQQQRATISFMITTDMKQQLAQLGHDEAAVRRLTPVQASLVIEHGLAPSDVDAKLPQLVADHEALAAAQAEARRAQAEEQVRREQQHQMASRSSSSRRTPLSSLPYASTNQDGQKVAAEDVLSLHGKPKVTWYEVVELDTDGHQTDIVGLYLSESEAALGLETHEFFAQRRRQDQKMTHQPQVSYEIRQTQR